jgi:GGDEF domain-containing protein
MSINRKEIRKNLLRIVIDGEETVYRLGLLKFLKHWRRKTDGEVERLAQQLKKAIAENRALALEVFGVVAVEFFEQLEFGDKK